MYSNFPLFNKSRLSIVLESAYITPPPKKDSAVFSPRDKQGSGRQKVQHATGTNSITGPSWHNRMTQYRTLSLALR